MEVYSVYLVFFLIIGSIYAAPQQKLEEGLDRSLEDAVASFSQSFYSYLKSRNEENFVFSPLSLHSALSLLYLGTKDKSVSQDQLGAAMGVITNPKLLKEKYNKMTDSYKKHNSFLYGNHIWISKGMTLKEDYQNQVLKNFDSKVSPIEFQRPQAVNDVNRWISDKTNGKIPKLVDSFSANTEMFMAK